jgi:hypothetical protein
LADRKSISGSRRKHGNDSLIEVGVGQEADHSSGSARKQLLPRALQFLLQIGRRRVGSREFIFDPFALGDIRLHWFFGAQIKGDRAVYLFQG